MGAATLRRPPVSGNPKRHGVAGIRLRPSFDQCGQVRPGIRSLLRADHHFQCLARIHRAISFWDLVKSDRTVEHQPRFDAAFKNVGQ